MPRAVFLDRDGVLNALVHRQAEDAWDSPYTLEELQVLPQAAEALRLIRAMGFLAIVVSNQPGVAKGKCDTAFLQRLDHHMAEVLARRGAALDGVYYCLHHPEATLPAYRTACHCRKPQPGLLLEAARRHGIDLAHSYMVGDRLVDVQAGLAAGCTAILVQDSPVAPSPEALGGLPVAVVRDVLDAALWVRRREEDPAASPPQP